MGFVIFGYRSQMRSLYGLLLSIALLGLIISGSPQLKTTVYIPPEVGIAFSVHVTNEQTRFDVSLDGDADLYLVVSSLGKFDQKYLIDCSVKRIDEPVMGSWEPLVPFDFEGNSQLAGSLTFSVVFDEDENRIQSVSFVRERNRILEREFHLHVTDGVLSDPKQYTRVSAVCVSEGKHVRVFLDGQEKRKNIAENLIEEIVRIFDEEIVPKSDSLYGRCRDIDGDGKFTILLSPWLGRLSGGKISLGGFVRSSDFDKGSRPPFGSHRDMMYLNSTLTPGTHLKALLAHEYAHAVAFGIRSRKAATPSEEDWLNEAIAHLSESYHDAGWSNIDHRIDAFLKNTSAYPLVVPDYYRAGLWRNHGCRGATFLFLQWCVDRFSWQLVPGLMQSSSCGIENISTCTGLAFEELYRRWSISLLQPLFQNLRSVDCYSRLGDYELDGPNIDIWNIEKQDRQQIHLKGTTSTFLKIPGKLSHGNYRLSLKAQPGTKLQVTLLKRSTKKENRAVRFATTVNPIKNLR